MEKKKLFEKLKRRFKALVLAGTLAGTATACGPSYYAGEEETTAKTIETTMDSINEKVTTTVKKTIDIMNTKDNNQEKNIDIEKLQNIRKTIQNGLTILKENQIEDVTEQDEEMQETNSSIKSNNKTTSKNSNNGSTNNNTSTGKTNNSGTSNNTSTVKTNNGETTNGSKGGNEQQGQTQEQTQPQTQEQTQQAEEYIRYELRNDYVLGDILSDIPRESEYAMYQVSDELRNELFGNYIHENQYGMSVGAEEAAGILIALNHDKGINDEMLAYMYEYESEENFSHYCDNMNLAYYQYEYGTKVDFTKYTIDQNVGNYINYVTDLFMEYMNGNEEPLMIELDNYFAGNSEFYDNEVVYYFMRNTQNPTSYYSEEIEAARQSYFNNVIYPMYDNFSQYIGKPYSK